MVLNCFVINMKNLRKLIGVARTILKSPNDLGPARPSSRSCEQVPKESFEVLLTMERCLGVFLCCRQQEWNVVK